jgi:spermidine synthase
VSEALAHRPRVLDSVELDAVVERLVESALPPTLRAPLAAPAVRLFVADPRRFLTRRRDRYDLILVGMPEPASGQANRYYTREFFAECAERLRPRGIVAFRLPAAENLWAPALVRRMASIDGAARTVFPDVLWLPGTTSVVLASQAPLPRDPDTLAARLAARGLTPRLVTPAYLRYLWTNDRTAEIAARLAAARSGPSRVPANSDARPICYQFTLILWLAKFVPGLAWMPAAPPSPAARGAGIAVGLALLAALWLVTRRRAGARRAIVVGAAGAVGMVTESLLLVAYQARAGVLYQDLGLLLMAFMAGLAAGAALADRLGRSARLAPLCSGEALLAALAVMGTALAAALGAGIGFGLLATGLWLAVAGALTAGVFAVASRQEADQAAAAGPLYAADLAGGCVGSLAASLLLIPLLGFVGTAATVAIVALLATAWA